LRVADPARTVIDILDAPRLGGGVRHAAEILDAYLTDHEPMRLVEHGDRLGNRAVFKRMGYLTEVLRRDEEALLAACRARVSSGLTLLDPDGPDAGARSASWGLRANVVVARQAPS
jgi:predicted transcriptional regulator of viral defense system